MRQRVEHAHTIQMERFRKDAQDRKKRISYLNADLTSKQLKKYCSIDQASRRLIENAVTMLGLSARSYDRILKVSRTIADLENAEPIAAQHIAEAIQYRSLDRMNQCS